MRKLIVVVTGVIILMVVNMTIYGREQTLSHGHVVLLELAPVDPRSLMQGDYMALRFKVGRDAIAAEDDRKNEDGSLVVTLDSRSVGTFARLADDGPLAANEILLRYRVRNGLVKFATNAFFFEEGSAKQYQAAKYGEFRVADNGDMLLTALRGENLAVLGAKP